MSAGEVSGFSPNSRWIARESIDSQGGGEAVAGDVDEDEVEDGRSVVAPGVTCEEVVAADLSHGGIDVVHADGPVGDGLGEEGLVDAPRVGEFLLDLAVAPAEHAVVELLCGKDGVTPPADERAGDADEGGEGDDEQR